MLNTPFFYYFVGKRGTHNSEFYLEKKTLTGLILVCSIFNTKMQTWKLFAAISIALACSPFIIYIFGFLVFSPHFASDQRDWPIFIRYFTKSGQSTILNWVGLSKLGKLLERLQKMLNILCLKTLPKHIIYILCIAVTCENNGDWNNGGKEGEGGSMRRPEMHLRRVLWLSQHNKSHSGPTR